MSQDISVQPYVLRCRVPMYSFETPFVDGRTGQCPRIPAGNDVVIQGLLLKPLPNDVLEVADITNITTLTVEVQASARSGSPFITKTATLDTTVDQTTWDDGSKQHFLVALSSTETNLASTVAGTEYYLVVYATLASGKTVTLAQTRLFVETDNVPSTAAPIQAGNLVAAGAVYDGSGLYTISGLNVGTKLQWIDGGSHDTNIVNGATTITTSGTIFTTVGTTLALHGTAGTTVTATVNTPAYYTAAEVDAIVAAVTGGGYSGSAAVSWSSGTVASKVVDISSLGLGSTPATIIPTLVCPSGGPYLSCAVVAGSESATQFIVQFFPGVIEATGYTVKYIIKP